MIPSLFLFLTLIPYIHADTPTLIINPLQTTHTISETLWGVFFEEINHAGQGGLYSEMISNRNFGGEDYAPWEPVGTGVGLNLDTSYPLNIHNQQALHITFQDNGNNKGVKNTVFWGIPITSGMDYTLSFYIIASKSSTLDVLLLNNDGSKTYYQSSIQVDQASITPDQVVLDTHSIAVAPWKKFNTPINVNFTDPNCQLQIIMNNPNTGNGAELWLDMVSFQPTQGWKGLPYIRADLADRVAELAPAFVRFPGGCYSEGDRLGDRFEWKKALGPIETRPGHWDLWNYWSEDGLGLYEYLCFIEQLNARPIWVVNSGNSHVEQINTINIQAWIQDALDSLEFAMGDVSTKWGAQRAAMGHPAPFNIYAVSIGNEDCGKDFYVTNYGAFYAALSKYYPKIRLIANCDLTTANPRQPVQLWDYHVYQSPEWFFQNQHEFDKYPRVSAHIFQSEYAVTQNAGQGNLIAAVAEATWMIGLERNSDLVDLASYAPLFVNTHDRYWNPDAIVFNSSASFGTPSYWTQYMFSRANDLTISGKEYLVTSSWSIDGSHLFAQSASIAPVTPGSYDNTTTHLLIIKLVNYNNKANNIIINLPFASYSISNDQIEWRTMTSGNANDENSLEKPNHIIPKDTTGMLRSSNTSYVFQASMPANSIHILRIQLSLANDDDDDVVATPY